MHEEKVMDTEALAVRGWISDAAAPLVAPAPSVARPPHILDGNLGPFRPFLIRLKARSLGGLKKSMGNQKYNLETF